MMAAPSQSNRKKSRRVLLKVFLSVSIVTILAGSYWQQQLLKGVDTVGSSLVAQWEAGLPKHSLGNIQASFMGTNALQTRIRNETERVVRENDAVGMVSEPAAKKARTDDGAKDKPSRQQQQQQETFSKVPPEFQSVFERSIASRDFCKTLKPSNTTKSHTLTVGNVTEAVADLPDFGIVNALQNYNSNPIPKCNVPPSTECNETMFTVIFMGYNPDRLHQLKRQVFGMTQPNSQWSPHVKEVLLVWNGERELTETQDGVRLKDLGNERNFRIFFPLKEGFPNDLMNRYHPRFNITTKAILFYDDDGPFYSYDAIMGGFELWKRNSNAQIGAMARRLDVLALRQEQEAAALRPLDDHAFIKHCRASGDSIFYNFYEFANYHARMVLPSGSFLHANYLCFLWHPALEPIREFVRAHPVHPDDVTVSTIVSHVAGRAPMVYSRRINPKDEKKKIRRRLLLERDLYNFPRRRLLWEDVSPQEWATMRSMAVNSLVSYFGGINSGSLGWCHGTEYQKKDKKGNVFCDPLMANVGMLPWMTPDHKPKDTCP